MRALNVVSGIIAVGLAATARAAETSAVQWRYDFNAAASEAQLQKKPLFILASTEWCGPCKTMQRTTFVDPAVVDILNKKCIPLHVDGDKNKERMNQWRVAAYPTVMIVATAGTLREQVVERFEGRTDAPDMLKSINQALKKQATSMQADLSARASSPASSKRQPKASEGPLQPPSPSDAESPVKPASFKASEKKSRPESDDAPLSLGGHCPVSMVDRAEMAPGKKTESAVYNGKKYLFATAENRKRFLESPSKFLPGAGGDCVVSLVDGGKRVEGDVKFPAIFGDKVFFLADKASREKFLKDPEAYVDSKGEPKPGKSK